MTTDELRSQLLAAPKNGYTRINETQRAEMEAYCKRYAAFMDACKTEREATAWTAKAAEDHGFKPFAAGMTLNPGDKIYYVNRKRASSWPSWAKRALPRVPISAPLTWTLPGWT